MSSISSSGSRLLTPAALFVATLVAVGLLAGCSSAGDDAAGSSSSAASITVSDLPGQKPVTLAATPKRIVAIGSQWIDTILAFGVTPVGYAKGSPDSVIPEWEVSKLSSSTEVTTMSDTGRQLAQIAKLNPDLILVPSYAPAAQRDQLAELAPTIGAVTTASVDPWDKVVTVAGTLLQQPDKATELIKGVNDYFASIKSENPGLAGKTYTLAFMYTAAEIAVLADPDDGAGRAFASIGMSLSPAILSERAKQNNTARVAVGPESVSLLDADLVAISAATPELAKEFRALPGADDLTGVRKGAAPSLSRVEITALNVPSVLSLPWVFNRLKPALAAAAKTI